MSYCRWSSMNHRCDVYAYESDDGFVVHVAKRRYLPDFSDLEDIGLPYDGETFTYDTENEMLAGLAELAHVGYVVPPSLLEYDGSPQASESEGS